MVIVALIRLFSEVILRAGFNSANPLPSIVGLDARLEASLVDSSVTSPTFVI
jgi:hypothetical protein